MHLPGLPSGNEQDLGSNPTVDLIQNIIDRSPVIYLKNK